MQFYNSVVEILKKDFKMHKSNPMPLKSYELLAYIFLKFECTSYSFKNEPIKFKLKKNVEPLVNEYTFSLKILNVFLILKEKL